ncbi:unnamed protein product [Cylindrotheca closterium]|uniref:SET domain-containing protein n=1 Tax=Cylindrotheca closterium TaxID=2856 RepID=A0AAD2G6G0_9STRA|nr:unnamed protein product [Cylindrotheca closterium]
MVFIAILAITPRYSQGIGGLHVFALVWLSLFACLSTTASCDLYLAQSTIPEAGLGVFTGISRNPGDILGAGDVCIPLLDPGTHHDDLFDPFDDFVWMGEDMGMKMEIESQVKAFCPGLDCAINCNLALINVEKHGVDFDDAGLHRSQHPGAGATTPYFNSTTKVKRRLPAGGELFKDYGDSWFTSRQKFDGVPLSDDFAVAQNLVDTAFNLGDANTDRLHLQHLFEDILIPIGEIWNLTTLKALPSSFDEVLIANREDIGMTHQPNATRSLEWLEVNGKCIDNIVPGRSTIDGAGHGAFASRNLPKGTVVTGTPLHHIPFQDEFTPMYRVVTRGQKQYLDRREVAGQQLVLNYCFGHPQTTLLLCPYGFGVNYINHNRSKANVRIRWAQNGITSHDESWLLKSPSEMLAETGAHLALDYIATRDIKRGEELFFDYGEGWEKAWYEHVKDWQSTKFWSSMYRNGRDWDSELQKLPLRTTLEALADPYPQTIQIRCHSILDEDAWTNFTRSVFEYGYPCEILDRVKGEDTDYMYTVKLTTEPHNEYDTEFESSETLVVNNVPRDAIRFVDIPRTSDIHLRDAFRQFIGLPNELMPEAWKNLKGKA